MKLVDIDKVYTLYANARHKWIVELTCDPLTVSANFDRLSDHLKKFWRDKIKAMVILSDLISDTTSSYEFDSSEEYENFLNAFKEFDDQLKIVAYSPSGKTFDSEQF